MKNYIGLYYPYIHFRDEGWLKSTLLYWDRIQRIVPEWDPAELGDSETVRRLTNEGFIQDVNPINEMRIIGDAFLGLIERHGDRLVQRYGIATPSRPGTEPWIQEAEPWKSTRPQPDADPRLTYVYYGKLDERLVSALVDADMATPLMYHDTLGMHPDLAAVYLTGLAELVARKTKSHPLTQEPMAHVAATGMTLERLTAGLLLEGETPVAEGPDEIRQEMASLAFRAVIPKGVAEIPVDRLIRFRKQRAGDRAEFQERIEQLSRELHDDLRGIRDPEVIRQHIQIKYERTLGVATADLEHELGRAGIESTLGVIVASLPVADIAATGGEPEHLWFAVPGMTFGIWQALRNQARTGTQRDPGAAYLHDLMADLGPQGLAARVAQAAKRLVGSPE
jgi:hypothetical protein